MINVRKLLCSAGIHELAFSFVVMRYGARVGDRCIHCGAWHKETKPVPFGKEWDLYTGGSK